jgi:peptide/nickel transport system substrate-binding protein
MNNEENEMKKISLYILLLSLTLVFTACAPETVVETVVVEKEGETVIETVVVEKEGETIIETVEVEKVVEVQVTPTPSYITEATKDLIGNLEGAVHVTDLPASYSEAPMLAEKVAAGELPPVEDRLPVEPLVVQPLSIGQYGGDYVRAFTGVGDVWGVRRPVCNDRFLWWDYTGNDVMPNLAKGYEMLDDGATLRLYLREGLMWSDGVDVTTDDILWWYENIYNNEDVSGTGRLAQLQFAGEDIIIEKVDDYTVDYKSSGPNWLFPETLTGFNGSTSPCTWMNANFGGGIAPAHYLEQYHPDFAGLAEVEGMAAEGGFDTWVQFFQNKASWEFNADMPVLTPWKTVAGNEANQPTWILERNPYYWAVDTDGNQLPYMDRMVNNIAQDREVLNLRAISGEYSFQSRHLALEKLPVYLENQGRGNYTVYLDPGAYGSNVQLRLNLTVADPVLKELFNNLDFRKALSAGIDRDQINEAFFLGIGTIGSPIPDPANPYYPGDEYRNMNHTLDVALANELLDGIGLTDTDADGYRLRPDGERLSIILNTVDAFVDNTGIGEMLADQLKEIGVDIIVEQVDRDGFGAIAPLNEFHAYLWDNGGTDRLFATAENLFALGSSSTFGPLHGQWYVTSGAEGEEPPQYVQDIMNGWTQGREVSAEERVAIGHQIWVDYVENVYAIGIVGLSPATLGVRIANNDLGNVPGRQLIGTDFWTPAISHVDTLYWMTP